MFFPVSEALLYFRRPPPPYIGKPEPGVYRDCFLLPAAQPPPLQSWRVEPQAVLLQECARSVTCSRGDQRINGRVEVAMMQNSLANNTCWERPLAGSVHERRSQQRIPCVTPATVTAGRHTIAASLKNISPQGLFLVTDVLLAADGIEIVLVLPEGLGMPLKGMVSCHGRVVRVSSCIGQYGIAAEIERIAEVP